MSFIGKAIKSVIGGISDVLGLSPKAPAPLPALTQATSTVAPTVANSTPDLDAAAQKQAATMQGGKTSTMLTGGMGEDETKLNTSKVLLGQ